MCGPCSKPFPVGGANTASASGRLGRFLAGTFTTQRPLESRLIWPPEAGSRTPRHSTRLPAKACKQGATGSSTVSGLLKPPANGGFCSEHISEPLSEGTRRDHTPRRTKNKEPVQVRMDRL
jgi:hypothetical protein